MKAIIYRTNKEMINAIKKSPKHTILSFDEAGLFPEKLDEIQAENRKEFEKMFMRFMKRGRGLLP